MFPDTMVLYLVSTGKAVCDIQIFDACLVQYFFSSNQILFTEAKKLFAILMGLRRVVSHIKLFTFMTTVHIAKDLTSSTNIAMMVSPDKVDNLQEKAV